MTLNNPEIVKQPKSQVNNEVKTVQDTVIKKISPPPRKTQGFDEITHSATQDTVFDEEKFLKLIKNVNQENQYKILNSNDRRIFDIVESSYEKVCQGKPLEINDFIFPSDEIHELTIIPNEQLAKYITYRYKYNQYSHLNIVEQYPPCVQLEITSRCNFRCIMCYQTDKSFSSKSKGYMGYMNLDVFKNAIDELEGNVESVTLASRGEPTLNPQISEMLDYMRGKFLASKINTNASVLTEKLIHKLLSADLQTIVFSVDASDKETYEKIRGKGNFEKVKANIELFHKIKSKYYSDSITISRVSGVRINESQDFSSMVDMWKSVVDQVAFVNYSPWESAYDNKVNGIKSPCSELWTRMFVWWDGRMNPCDYDYKSILTKHLETRFPDKSIANFWSGDFYNSLRKKHLTSERWNVEPCTRCKSV
jgi:MoaA/NifB/PqqE/SkfB family radical SAM enzyme